MSLSFQNAITHVPYTGWLKQPTLISNSFGVRRSKIRVPAWLGFHCGEKPHSGSRWSTSPYILMWWRVKELTGVSLIKTLIPLMKVSPS